LEPFPQEGHKPQFINWGSRVQSCVDAQGQNIYARNFHLSKQE